MIRYALVCSRDHPYESWFRDSAAFDTLAMSGQLTCPVCGTEKVRKALMAPSVQTSRRRRAAGPLTEAQPGPAPPTTPDNPPPAAPAEPSILRDDRERRLRAMLRALHREITEKADNVGRAFAEEARRIHEGDAAPRSIYGEASRDEVDALLEDGIPLLPMPIPPDEHN